MAIILNQLEFGFTAPLQPPVTQRLQSGSITAVIGPNGSGKTTLFNTVLNILPPIAGSCDIEGSHGALFQDRALPLSIPMDRWIRHLSRLWEVEINHSLLERLDLPVTSSIIRRLSGGAAQKLAIYSALHHLPNNAILDEPTNNLDAPSRQNLYDVIHEMREAGTTFFISSHQASDIAALNAEVINFSSPDSGGHSAIVTFSGSVVARNVPSGANAVQTATGLLISSNDSIDFMAVAVAIAHENEVSITSFQVLS